MELSKSYQRLQIRKEGEREACKKAREKLVRAMLNIFPPFGILADACMAMTDAQKEQLIEDAIKFLELQFGEMKIKELELIDEVESIQNQLSSMVSEIENLKKLFLEILISKEYYSSFELKEIIIRHYEISRETFDNTITIINKVDAHSTELKDVKAMVASLTEMIAKQGSIGTSKTFTEGSDMGINTVDPLLDDEVIIKMGEQLITKINELIENNELESAESILSGVTSASNFNNLNDDLRVGILSTKGSIFIKLFDKPKAKEIYEELGKISCNNKRKWNYFFKYGIIMANKELVDQALGELETLGLSTEEIMIKKSSYFLSRGEVDEVIQILEEDKKEPND